MSSIDDEYETARNAKKPFHGFHMFCNNMLDFVHDLRTRHLPLEQQIARHLEYAWEELKSRHWEETRHDGTVWSLHYLWSSLRPEEKAESVSRIVEALTEQGVTSVALLGLGEHSLVFSDGKDAYSFTLARDLSFSNKLQDNAFSHFFTVQKEHIATFDTVVQYEIPQSYVVQKSPLMNTRVLPQDVARLDRAIKLLGLQCEDLEKPGNTCYLKDAQGHDVFYTDENGQRCKMVALLDDNILRPDPSLTLLTRENFSALPPEDQAFLKNWIEQHPSLVPSPASGVETRAPRTR